MRGTENIWGRKKAEVIWICILSSDAYIGQCPGYQWILGHSYVRKRTLTVANNRLSHKVKIEGIFGTSGSGLKHLM